MEPFHFSLTSSTWLTSNDQAMVLVLLCYTVTTLQHYKLRTLRQPTWMR